MNLLSDSWTMCLFYQYKELAWQAKGHKAVLNKVTGLATLHGVTVRGRCVTEGLNCTLTASANDVRAFCYALRRWDPEMFDTMDFKLEDGVPHRASFRICTLRKVDEFVGYALNGVKAPSLCRHVEEHPGRPQVAWKDTILVHVLYVYESDIRHFQPPD